MRRVAFVDLETTGTNEVVDHVIEVGIVLTDLDWKVTRENSWVIRPRRLPLAELRSQSHEVVRKMHDANGLWGDVGASNLDPQSADREISDWILQWGGDKVLLAGSGVGHFDSRFIKAQLPLTAKRFTHYVLDVGVLRRACEWANRHDLKHPTPPEAKTHRALEDARLHLEEWLHYRTILGSVGR